jgi:hypothetical protein
MRLPHGSKKVAERALDHRRAQFQYACAVIDHQAEMALLVRPLAAPPAQRQELVAHLDERHGETAVIVAMATPKREREDRAIEIKRCSHVADLKCDMVDADEPRLAILRHVAPFHIVISPELNVGRWLSFDGFQS